LVIVFGSKYSIRAARDEYGLELTEKDVAAARDNIARDRKSKMQDGNDKEEEDGDEDEV
jgi:hypothetical protein